MYIHICIYIYTEYACHLHIYVYIYICLYIRICMRVGVIIYMKCVLNACYNVHLLNVLQPR